ncbi:MAG: ABC transporter ATP-binding protein/permease [Geminicoccaceae bacterium]
MRVIGVSKNGIEANKASADTSGENTYTIYRQLKTLWTALASSPHRFRIWLLSAGIVVTIGLNMVGQVRLNDWKGDFYNALEQADADGFILQIGVFILIVAVLLTMVVAETWIREMLEVRLREWLTHDLLDQWLSPKRAYLLGFAGQIGENPDQRMQADCQRLTEFGADLAIGLLRSSLLLLSFIGVLWGLSNQVVFTLDGSAPFTIPGYLVWCALAYAISGSWLTWLVGRPLIAINAERYAREADLRFGLVRISESAEGISLYSGERDERRALDPPVTRVIDITRQLANGLARLTWITSGYGWLALIVPILVAAPGYFQGTLSFGGLMMVVGAFNHVQNALRWFVDNFPRIADWRATLLRVTAYRDSLQKLETMGEDAPRIERIEHQDGALELDNLQVLLTNGRAALDEDRIEVLPGEHLAIVGEPGSGKSSLFRALAGIWPWGTGKLRIPKQKGMMFLPQRPYLPLGSIRAAVAYPGAPLSFDDESVKAVLERVQLDHLIPLLDQEERWDKSLSLDQQQRLVFARLLLHKPSYVVLDDVGAALAEEHRQLMYELFKQELSDSTVVNITRTEPTDSFYNRTVRLRHMASDERLKLALEQPIGATA